MVMSKVIYMVHSAEDRQQQLSAAVLNYAKLAETMIANQTIMLHELCINLEHDRGLESKASKAALI